MEYKKKSREVRVYIMPDEIISIPAVKELSYGFIKSDNKIFSLFDSIILLIIGSCSE